MASDCGCGNGGSAGGAPFVVVGTDGSMKSYYSHAAASQEVANNGGYIRPATPVSV